MTNNIGQVEQSQKIMEQDQLDQLSGAGALPQYLINQDFVLSSLEGVDRAQVNGPPINSTGVNALLRGGQAPVEDEETYIPNSNEYNNAVNRGAPASNDPIGIITSTEQAATEDILSFSEEDFCSDPDGDGYLEVNAEALEAWEQRLLARANILASLLVVIMGQSESRRLAEEAFTGVAIQEQKHSYKEAFARKIKMLQNIARTAISKLFEYVNTKNQELYTARMNSIQNRNKCRWYEFWKPQWWRCVWNYCSGGYYDKKDTRAARDEQIKYLDATNKTLAALQAVLLSMAEMLRGGMGEEDFTTLAIIEQLKKFGEALQTGNFEPTADGGSGSVSVLTGFGMATSISEGEGNQYIDDVDMTQLIDDYRRKIVGLQNGSRMATSLRLFQHDLRNIAREKFTGLSGIRNDADLLMQSQESALGHTLQVFDSAASQLMLKISLHNSAVKSQEDLRNLERAQPLRIIAFLATLTMLALSIAIMVLTAGEGAPVAILIAYAAVAIVKGLANYFANMVANDLEGYTAPPPSYIPHNDGSGHNDGMLGELERMDQEEEANAAAAAHNQGLAIRNGDKYYSFDAQRFALYELKQKMFDNVIRMLFSLLKNSRDMRRVAEAEFTGSSITDSGGALLQNAVENILLQRQMILTTIKFQHQEVVNARNIQRQKDISWERGLVGLLIDIGAAVLGAVGGGLGGAYAAALTVASILVSLASSVFQIVCALYDHHWDMGLESEAKDEFRQILNAQSRNSTEAKLDAAEMRAYQNLLDQGIVSTGGGYSGVNFALVTSIYAQIGRIYAAKDALAKARSLRSEMRNIVKQEFTGQNIGTIGELTKSINSASFSAAMKTVGNLVNFLNARVQVLNRANDARKQAITAGIVAGINLVISAVGIGFACSSNAALNAVSNLASPLMALVSTLTSLVSSIVDNTSGLGAYENYDPKTTVDRTGRRAARATSVDADLDQTEYEIMLEMNSELVNSFSGGFLAVSSQSAVLNARMRGIFMVREALATARSILSSMRNEVKSQFTGKAVAELDFGKESVEQYQQVAMAMLDSLKSALDTICERQNQINEAEKQIVFGALQAAISLASIGVGAYSAKVKTELVQLASKQQEVNNHSSAYASEPTNIATNESSPLVPPPSMETATEPLPSPAPEADPVPASIANPAVEAGSTSTPTVGRVEDGAETHRPDGLLEGRSQRSLQELNRTLSRVSSALSFAGSLIRFIVQEAYHSVDGEKPHAEVKPDRSNHKEKSSGKQNAFTAFSRMDAAIDQSECNLAALEINHQTLVYMAQNNKRLFDSIFAEMQAVVDFTKAFVEPERPMVYQNNATEPNPAPEAPLAPPAEPTVLRRENPFAAAAHRVEAPQPPIAPPAPTEEAVSPSTTALLEYANRIEQQMAAARGIVVQTEAAPAAEDAPEAPAPSIEQLRAERARLVVQRDTAVQQLRVLREQLAAAPEQVRQLEEGARTEIAQLRERQAAIQQRLDTERLSPEQRTQLEGELRSLQSQRGALEHAQDLVGTRVAELESLVAQARGQVDRLTAQIRQIDQQIAQAERAPVSQAAVVIPAVAAAVEYRPRDQYERALRDMEVLERQASDESERISSISSATYC